MNKNLLENLKGLRKIQPDFDYTAQSRFLILAEPTAANNLPRFRIITQIYKPAFAIGLISVFVLLIALGSVYQVIKPGQNDLVVRANAINGSIQVKLNEIKYLIEHNNLNAENILNIQSLLEKTTNNLKEASILSQKDKDLEKSLEKIRSAQELLLKIDAMLK